MSPNVDPVSECKQVRPSCRALEVETGSSPPRTMHYIDDGWDFSEIFDELQQQYTSRQTSIEVNFRSLVPLHSGVDRATHLIHPYPAKLLVNIPVFFLRCHQIGLPGHVRDPFCGSGTVLLEGLLRGWQVSGADTNPLARLITSVKISHVDQAEALSASDRVRKRWKSHYHPFSPVVDVDYWFGENTKRQLGGLCAGIREEVEPKIKQFLSVCLSACVRKASFADPKFSVPVRVQPDSDHWQKALECDVIELFQRAVIENLKRIAVLRSIIGTEVPVAEIGADARAQNGHGEAAGTVDLIITSPPYGGAQKYVRASSLSLGWLDMAPTNRLRTIEAQTIGREHYNKEEYQELILPDEGIARDQLLRLWKKNPLRAHIAGNYLVEMKQSINQMYDVSRPGAALILVLGDNAVLGEEFPTSRYIREMARHIGFNPILELVDDIRSRGLMTKRNSTAGIILREHIQVYRKPE